MNLRFDLLLINPDSHSELETALQGIDPAKVPELLELVADEEKKLQGISSWLLRRGIESGLEFTERDWLRWMDALGELSYWAAKLHFCQAYHQADVPLSDGARLRLEAWIQEDQPFVRAWGMSALVRDATLREGQEDRIEALIAQALGDPAASVRARARNVAKSLKKR